MRRVRISSSSSSFSSSSSSSILRGRGRRTRTRTRRSAGFTLIELLIVTAIMALVIGVIGACLAGGMRVWDSAREFNRAEAGAVVALQVIERDLHNTFPFHAVPFRGDVDGMAFPGLLPRETDAGEPDFGLGTVTYSYNRNDRSLLRRTTDLPAAASDGEPAEELLDGLTELRLRYYEPPVEKGATGKWVDTWANPTNFPSRVRLDLTFGEQADRFTLTRTVLIPVISESPHEPTAH